MPGMGGLAVTMAAGAGMMGVMAMADADAMLPVPVLTNVGMTVLAVLMMHLGGVALAAAVMIGERRRGAEQGEGTGDEGGLEKLRSHHGLLVVFLTMEP